jgi:hypothetical protein
MKPCPNCSQPVSPGVHFCPNCGADVRSLWTEPDASGLKQLDMSDFEARRRSDGRSQALGVVLSLLIGIGTFPIGFIILLLIWAGSYRSNSFFAKGIKTGAWIVLGLFLLLILGALVMCSGIH